MFGHGAGAGIDHPLIAGIARACAAAGVAVLRYQFPFMERRGGSGFGRDARPVAIATVASAFRRGRELAPASLLLAGGHSYGGRMTSLAAAEGLLADAAGLVLLSFPLHGAKAPSTERAAHLRHVDVPMLMLSGARDTMASAPLLEDLAAGLPETELVRIAGADHGWKAPARDWPDGPVADLAHRIAGFAARLA